MIVAVGFCGSIRWGLSSVVVHDGRVLATINTRPGVVAPVVDAEAGLQLRDAGLRGVL